MKVELVICGRSVDIVLCALAPHFWAFAWTAMIPMMTEKHGIKAKRGMQKIITA